MPLDRYLKIKIGDFEAQVTDPKELPLSIDYMLENPENFQEKTAAEAQQITIPATLLNDQAANTYRNPDVVDFTPDERYRSMQPCVIIASGYELLIGKAFLKLSGHTDRPEDYQYDIFGSNADWRIDLSETTFYDLMKHITFIFTKTLISDSWSYNGRNENMPFVFAPVRYRDPVGGYTINNVNGTDELVADDTNFRSIYFKPSFSPYWILYWGFKSAGYKIQSNFLDTDYFRRKVMPWTWGNFLYSEGSKLDELKFLAKSTEERYLHGPLGGEGFTGDPVDLKVTNTSTDGGFDNSGNYSYDPSTCKMTWDYSGLTFGTLQANFHLTLNLDAHISVSGEIYVYIKWYKNGSQYKRTQLFHKHITITTGWNYIEIIENWEEITVNEGDTISAVIEVFCTEGELGGNRVILNVIGFTIDYFRIPLNGEIKFENYLSLKNWKFIDLLRGIIDMFNMTINTDSINKVVYIEPTHEYYLENDPTIKHDGYYKKDFIIMDEKEDLSKRWELENYSDFEQVVSICFADDNADGLLKTIQDRTSTTLGSAKYVLPNRFKSGKGEVRNRFFSPVMHFDNKAWENITGISPQLVVIVPENISNTSASEASNTFAPKLCHYKGMVTDAGGWVWGDGNNDDTPRTMTSYPYMFAVNYKPGGEKDPILSYSDEAIPKDNTGLSFVSGKGLFKRFYLQRFAIMRNGQWYHTWFKLSNSEVAGNLHREMLQYRGNKWEFIGITAFRPLVEESTALLMRKWSPIEKRDFENTYPSESSIISGKNIGTDDIKYSQLKCLVGDIPKDATA